jgi:transposase InsO family protein
MDQTEDGRQLKMLPIVDEYTRECLSIDVERHITAQDVVARLQQVFQIRGVPDFIRSDNGPEFIATAVKECLSISGVKTLGRRILHPLQVIDPDATHYACLN